MKLLEWTIAGGLDAPMVLCEANAVFGSLNVKRPMWARVVTSMGHEIPPYLKSCMHGLDGLLTEATLLINRAILPGMGEQAMVNMPESPAGETRIEFLTPGGVKFSITKHLELSSLNVAWRFGRNSHYAANRVLQGLLTCAPTRETALILDHLSDLIRSWKIEVGGNGPTSNFKIGQCFSYPNNYGSWLYITTTKEACYAVAKVTAPETNLGLGVLGKDLDPTSPKNQWLNHVAVVVGRDERGTIAAYHSDFHYYFLHLQRKYR